jgi:hypothetical protein
MYRVALKTKKIVLQLQRLNVLDSVAVKINFPFFKAEKFLEGCLFTI